MTQIRPRFQNDLDRFVQMFPTHGNSPSPEPTPPACDSYDLRDDPCPPERTRLAASAYNPEIVLAIEGGPSMSTISIRDPAADSVANPTAPGTTASPAAPGRPVSLDAYRSVIMLLLVSGGLGLGVLENHPGWEWLARQFEHVAWEGCTFWDLVQPAFTFMVGVAMPLATRRRLALGDTPAQVFRHVLWRAFLLVVLSNLFSNWGRDGALRLQFINVLAQIAFGYVLCFLITRLPFVRQALLAVALMSGYTLLYVAFPGPDGPWSPTGNIGTTLDLAVLGYNYSGYYTTLNFVGNALTILFGCWTGNWLLQDASHVRKLQAPAAAALAAFLLGISLAPVIPMVKRLWTLTFASYSTGRVIVLLMGFYWAIEVNQRKRWAFVFVVLGMNSLFAYSLGQIGLKGWLDRGLAPFTGRFAFLGDLDAIPHQLLVLACLWYVCYWLYQRKIFFKL